MIAYLVSTKTNSDSFAGKLEIIGDVGLAQQFQSIMKNIDLDWEEYLSHWLGDTMAHKLGNFLRDSIKFVSETRKTLALDVSEYLQYEKEVLPDHSEIVEFSDNVDELRNDIERLKVRIGKLGINNITNI